MPQVNVLIAGRNYLIACDAGEEAHLGELAAFSLVIAMGTVVVGSIFLKLAQRHGLQD